jgi:hypothetical protein
MPFAQLEEREGSVEPIFRVAIPFHGGAVKRCKPGGNRHEVTINHPQGAGST